MQNDPETPDSETKSNNLGEPPAYLFDCSLRQAFKKFVLEDPEVTALAKLIVEKEGKHRSVFEEGQYPGPLIDFNWALDLTASNFAWGFVRPLLLFLDVPIPEASERIRNVAAIIVDRWQRLRGFLIAGKIIARGTFVRTGMVGAIDPPQWARSGLYVDVHNGDLLEEENYKPVLRWSGLMLIRPTIVESLSASDSHKAFENLHAQHPAATKRFHVKPRAHDLLPPSTIPTRDSTLARAETTRQAPETRDALYRACVDWLLQIIRASPDTRTESKERLWKKAQEKWPGTLSERSFIAARAEALRTSGASAWSTPGATRKSQRGIRRTD